VRPPRNTRKPMSVPQSIIDSAKAVEQWLEDQNKPTTTPDSDLEFILRIGYSNVYRVGEAIAFSAGLQIDADGAPRAYNQVSSRGLDALANAGHPGNWWAIATNNGRPSGEPVIQGDSEPAPGFYVSTTALENLAFHETQQRRYVDASTVPFIVLPFGAGMGLKLGDFFLVYNIATGDNDFAIYADVGPRGQIGEGSIALAEAIKVPSSPRTGGVSHGIVYVGFPGSGKGYQEKDVWFGQAAKVFTDWGGLTRLKSLAAEDRIL
jgi:Fungal chitosanase of glycosyl hydrolase group 75